jgi:hypothetical protein
MDCGLIKILPRYQMQPAASMTHASIIRIEGCSPMRGMSAKKLTHARMTRINETRNTTGFGAFKVGMVPP